MRAGQLRHRLAIQTATETRTDSGESVKLWTTTAQVWGSVEPMSGKELFTAQQVSPNVTHKITMRGRPLSAVSPQQRIAFGDRIFQVDNALNKDERGIQTTALAIEVPA